MAFLSFLRDVHDAERKILIGLVFVLWTTVPFEGVAGQQGSLNDSGTAGSSRGAETGSPGDDDVAAGGKLRPIPIGPNERPAGVLSDLDWEGNVAELHITEDDEALEGHGPCVVIDYEAPFDTILFVSASSRDRDCLVQLRDLDGAVLAEDDDSGSAGFGKDALVRLEVGAGELLELVVSVDAGSQGPVLLKVFEVRESEETLAAAARIKELAVEAQAAVDAGESVRGRRLVGTGIALAAGVEDAARSWVLLLAISHLGRAAWNCGDLEAMRALFESELAAAERAVPPDHPSLLAVRVNLAAALSQIGDLPSKRAVEELVLAARERTLPPDHPELLSARSHLAITLHEMGDLPEAQALFESVLEACERTLPADHLELLRARNNHASSLLGTGDLLGALALCESALAAGEQTLHPDHFDLLAVRGTLAGVLSRMGDLPGARALEESVLAASERTLPLNHSSRLGARLNLAGTMKAMGDLSGALALQESVVAALERSFPSEHPDLLAARGNLAATMRELGELPRARALQESVVAAWERSYSSEHPDLLRARGHLAETASQMGDLPRARALEESVLAAYERTLPPDHPDLLRARRNLALTRARARDWAEAGECTLALVRGILIKLQANLRFSRSQWEEYSLSSGYDISWCLSLAAARPEAVEEKELFHLIEAARSIGAVRERVLRQQVVPAELAQELARLEREIVDLGAEIRWALSRPRVESSETEGAADSGSSGGTPRATFAELHRQKQRLEAERLAKLTELTRSQGLDVDSSLEGIQASLPPGTAAVGFWGYTRWPIDPESGETGLGVDSLLAFVVRAGQPVQRIELGAQAQVRAALTDWLAAISVQGFRGGEPEAADPLTEDEAGSRLRGLVFDPLREALGDCRRAVLALDGPLHLVPFGALPGSAAHGEVGVLSDRFDFEVRTSLKERTVRHRPELHEPSLLVVGGIRYDQAPKESEGVADASPTRASPAGGVVDGKSDRSGSRVAYGGRSNHSTLNFDWLRRTGEELRDLKSLFELRFEDVEGTAARVTALTGRAATRETFLAQASGVRFLHLATHAYVEDKTVPCIFDARTDDGDLQQLFLHRREQACGLSPLSITGVAFAGANLEDPERGGSRGVVAAAEIADLDLTGCELVVFSACGSSVGIERAGLGLASLQQAAFIAGARMTLTSLYKVPDEATRELMRKFYDAWWVQGMRPREALEAAQRRMREEKDPLGGPMWSTRDWAGWVMSGDEG